MVYIIYNMVNSGLDGAGGEKIVQDTIAVICTFCPEEKRFSFKLIEDKLENLPYFVVITQCR
jgi:hypothetical protein